MLCGYPEEIILENVSVDTFYETQAGNYRNRRGGILTRLEYGTGWFPSKRLDLCEKYKGDIKQNKIYRYRSLLSRLSVAYFKKSKKYGSFLIFKILMFPNGTRGVLKTFKIFLPIDININEKADDK